MKQLLVFICLPLILASCEGSGSSSPTGSVSGFVTSNEDGSVVEGATIRIDGKSAQTSVDGTFLIGGVNSGKKTISASKVKYETYTGEVDIASGLETRKDIVLNAREPMAILTGANGVGVEDTSFKMKQPVNKVFVTPVGIYKNELWVAAPSGVWIGPDDGDQSAAQGTYEYVYEFNLNNGSGVTMNGVWASDNGATISLNGNTIIDKTGAEANNYSILNEFEVSDSYLFLDGKNVLTFSIENGFGPTGLYFSAEVFY